MERHDPFDEMDRMFEQLRTSMFSAMGTGRTDGRMDAANLHTAIGDRNAIDTAGRGKVAPDRKGTGAVGNGSMNMDLKKHGDEYVFVADLPGFETEQIDLRFENDALVLSAESQLREESMGGEAMGRGAMDGNAMDDDATEVKPTSRTGDVPVRQEFVQSRRVSKRITVPEPVVEEEIEASYRNGVLEVHLPLVTNDLDEGGKRIDVEN